MRLTYLIESTIFESDVPESVVTRAQTEYDRLRRGRHGRRNFLRFSQMAANIAAAGTDIPAPLVTKALRAALRQRGIQAPAPAPAPVRRREPEVDPQGAFDFPRQP